LPLSLSIEQTKVHKRDESMSESPGGTKFKIQPIPALMLIYRF
jgi:hypothetical protein